MFKRMLLLTSLLVLLNANVVKAGTVIDIDISDELDKIKVEKEKDEFYMLQKIVVAEAHDQSPELMAEMMLCILNRVESNDFPDTIEGVIKEKNQFVTYPDLYNKYEPNETSEQALLLLPFIKNKGQLFFENTKPGSWISTNKELIFMDSNVSFYK